MYEFNKRKSLCDVIPLEEFNENNTLKFLSEKYNVTPQNIKYFAKKHNLKFKKTKQGVPKGYKLKSSQCDIIPHEEFPKHNTRQLSEKYDVKMDAVRKYAKKHNLVTLKTRKVTKKIKKIKAQKTTHQLDFYYICTNYKTDNYLITNIVKNFKKKEKISNELFSKMLYAKKLEDFKELGFTGEEKFIRKVNKYE